MESSIRVRADRLLPGDQIIEPVNLRGAEIASNTEMGGQTVCFVINHPDPSVTKFHSPLDYVFTVNRPDD